MVKFRCASNLLLVVVLLLIVDPLSHLYAVCAAVGGAYHPNLGALQQVHGPQHQGTELG